jgi:hypothetical protein
MVLYPRSDIITIAIVVLSTVLPGCVLRELMQERQREEITTKLNMWLGKTKDDRIRRVGSSTQCAKLNSGEETCDWVFRGVANNSLYCSQDGVCKGGGGGSWENHTIFTFDQDGIAREWNYWGSWGELSSRIPETAARPAPLVTSNDVSTMNNDAVPLASQVSQQTKAVPIVGISLGASRGRVHEAIIKRGGKLIARAQSPDRDEYDSSDWADGSHKLMAIFTPSGELAVIGSVYPVADQEEGARLATGLRQQVEEALGMVPHNRQDGWPVAYGWQAPTVFAGIFGEGKTSPNVTLLFSVPDLQDRIVGLKQTAPLH